MPNSAADELLTATQVGSLIGRSDVVALIQAAGAA
jgi:hypothetical protein